MIGSIKIFAVIVLVAFVAVLLAWLIPIPILLELFLILVGILVIAAGSLVIAGEVNNVMDLRHHQRMQRERRELEFQGVLDQQTLHGIRYRRASRRRSQH